MSLGMGITISFAAIISSKVRTSKYKNYKFLMNFFTYFGIFILFFMGGLLLL
jgi:hypothetical protein